jgi:hypothetical protein
MKQEHIDMLKSAVRHFAITAGGIYAAGVHDWKAILGGTIAAIVGPAIRGIDKNDPAFGLIADVADVEIKKIVKKLSK